MVRGELSIRKAPEPLDSRAIGPAADRSSNDLIHDLCVPPPDKGGEQQFYCSYTQEIHDQIFTEVGNNDTMAGSLEPAAFLQGGHPDGLLARNILGHQLFSGAPLTRLTRTLTVIQGPQQARP